MATLQKIRDRGGLLMIIIGVALLAFIVGDGLKNGKAFFQNSQNEIAEVDGESVAYEDFQSLVNRNLQNAESSQKRALSNEEKEQVRRQSWGQFIQRKLLGKEMEELGISVSLDEIAHIIKTKSDPFVGQFFGGADYDQITNYISTLEEEENNTPQKQQWKQFQASLKEKRAQEKYYTLLSKGLGITNNIAAANTETKTANLKYIIRNYNTIPDSAVLITKDEIKDYYNSHKEEFKQYESRKVEFLKIDVTPSVEDFSAGEKRINDIKERFENDSSPLEFVKAFSDIREEPVYLKKEEINNPDLATYAFSRDTAEAYGPYLEGDLYKIVRVSSTKMLPDSIRASHILISPKEQTKQAYEEAKLLIDSINKMIEEGANFAELAKQYSVDNGSAINGGDLGWFTREKMVKPFSDAAFNTEVGETSMATSQYGVHIIKVTKKGPLAKKVQLATLTHKVDPSEKTFTNAYIEAGNIAEKISSTEDLKAVAKEQNLSVLPATIFASSTQLENVPNSKSVIRAAFKGKGADELLRTNSNSTIFELDDCYLIAGLTEVNEKGYQSISKVTKQIKAKLRRQKKAELLTEELKNDLSTATTLEAIAEKQGLELHDAAGVSFNSPYLPGLGPEPQLVAAATASGLAPNQLSQPISGNQGVFVISLNEINDTPNEQILQNSSMQYNQLLTRRVQAAFQALYENANVKDKRYKF